MQFIGQYSIDTEICDRLVAMFHEVHDMGLTQAGCIGGMNGHPVIDTDTKDSTDILFADVPDELIDKYNANEYLDKLAGCVQLYIQDHPVLNTLGPFSLGESPVIQHYEPGGGFKKAHFERTNVSAATRMMVFMTYLNTVKDGGGTRFEYQKKNFRARKGSTLLWPTDWTHTHRGLVSKTEEKYIITGWLNFS
jgi:prolyl 4-hydroxylase